MFPRRYYSSSPNPSKAEKTFFDELQDSGMYGWAFHSLDLSESVNPNKPQSEADFVILTHQGLLVVEVKGGGIIRNNNGTWQYRGAKGLSAVDHRGPFKQANEAMHSLKNILRKQNPRILDKCAYGWAVAFPNTKFNVPGQPEWKKWQIYDKRNLGRERTVAWLKKNFDEMQHANNRPNLTNEELDGIRDAIRTEIVTFTSLNDLNAGIFASQFKMTRNQVEALDGLKYYDRIIVEGGAGTGKTFLAAEFAKSHAEEGESVIYITPGKALMYHVENQAGMWGVTVCVPDDLPLPIGKVDRLVFDEAQDLMDTEIFDICEKNLKGGITDGKWSIFLDPNNQAELAGRFNQETYAEVCRKASLPPWPLNLNCRNTDKIVSWVQRYTRGDIGKPTVMEGAEPSIEFLETSEILRLLEEELKVLLDNDVQPRNIIILSPNPDTSIALQLPERLNELIVRFKPEHVRGEERDKIKLATPLEFKGLENDYLFCIDFGDFTKDGNSKEISELYVSLTRAKVKFHIYFAEEHREEITRFMLQNIQSENE